jgi:predicted amidohydrolase YtcJ
MYVAFRLPNLCGNRIKEDKFIAVGTNRKVKALADKETRLVDLKGAMVIPGFADMHDHLFNACRFMWRGVDMIGVTSLDPQYQTACHLRGR